MNIFVGNLPFSATENDLRSLFEEFGEVETVNVIKDRETGRSRGFAFVEMNNSDADAAIKNLNGKEFQGRAIKVNQAEQRKARAPRRSW
ncbi:MAG: RNA-binding protein [Nitrospinae bacterium]|nr:RNA-binding protein [Nitrospinota bacterium]